MSEADKAIVQQEPQEGTAIVNMIERVATDPNMDVAKLEKMLDMQERILNKQSEMEFFGAMNKAQAEMTRVSADASNPQTRSKYASYAALDRALRPIYGRHGMSLSFDTEHSQLENHILVVCYVSHISGYTKRYSVDMPTDGKGAKGNAVMTTTHATGAAMSYGMRYLLKMIFNVAVGEDDNDGNIQDLPDITDSIVAISEAQTMEELQKVFKESYQTYNYPLLRKRLVEAKDARKKELS